MLCVGTSVGGIGGVNGDGAAHACGGVLSHIRNYIRPRPPHAQAGEGTNVRELRTGLDAQWPDRGTCYLRGGTVTITPQWDIDCFKPKSSMVG